MHHSTQGEPLARRSAPYGNFHHIVQFYEDPGFLGEAVARFIAAGLDRDEAALVVARQFCREQLLEHLARWGFDVDGFRRSGQLVLLDAVETLERLAPGGQLDEENFKTLIGGQIERSAAVGRGGTVRVYGEMVDVLCGRGDLEAALELEGLWASLGSTRSFVLLCAYSLASFPGASDDVSFRRVCGLHSHVVPTESYPQSDLAEPRHREISRLQQRARALETEIARRKQLEESLRDRLRELQRTQEALRGQREQLEQAVRMRDEFLSIASHEFRNPLNALQLQIASVERAAGRATGALAPNWVSGRLSKAGEQVVRLRKLIDSLMDVSRISAGQPMKLEFKEVELVSVVTDALEQFKDELPGRLVRLSSAGPVPIWCDPLRLAQLVACLLSNAIRYGASKPIEVSIEANSNWVTLRVSDQGIGIAPEALPRIFERFERAAPIRKFGGFGVGLWMAKRIVEALHGRIAVESSQGLGSTFTVELPRTHGQANSDR